MSEFAGWTLGCCEDHDRQVIEGVGIHCICRNCNFEWVE